MTQKEISPLVELLGLQPHVEGGWYKRLWNSEFEISQEVLGDSYSGSRHSASSIYFYFTKANNLIGIQYCPMKFGCGIPVVQSCLVSEVMEISLRMCRKLFWVSILLQASSHKWLFQREYGRPRVR